MLVVFSEDDIDVCSEQGLTKLTKKPLPKNKKQKTEPKIKKMTYVMMQCYFYNQKEITQWMLTNVLVKI